MSTFKRLLLLSSIAVCLASCSPIVDVRGHGTDDANFSQVIPGQTQEDDVRALFGSPSTQSNFGDPTWYYITQKKERRGVLATEVTEQHVTEIRFDDKKTVAEIKEYTQQDGKDVQIVSKETPSEGQHLGFFEQLLGNFGRFGTPGRGIDPRDLGR